MAKKKKLSTYQRRKNVERQARLAIAQKKRLKTISNPKIRQQIRYKQKLYKGLLNDYIDKQIDKGKYKEGKKGIRKQAEIDMKKDKVLENLRSDDPFLKLNALKKTTRRDGVPESIPVGETPSVYSQAA